MKVQIIFEISTLDDSEVTQEDLERILLDTSQIPNKIYYEKKEIKEV